MKAVVVSQTGVGTTPWVMIDTFKNPVNVGLACVHTGTVSYSVEYTYDDVFNGATATAWPHSVIVTQTGDKDGSITFPVKAVRVNMASGTGSVTLTVLQSGHGVN